MIGSYNHFAIPVAFADAFTAQLDTAGIPWTLIGREGIGGDPDHITPAVLHNIYDVACHDNFDRGAVARKARRARETVTGRYDD